MKPEKVALVVLLYVLAVIRLAAFVCPLITVFVVLLAVAVLVLVVFSPAKEHVFSRL